MTKGILIRSGSTEIHKLDDDGNFKLGLNKAATLNVNATLRIEDLASDVVTMLDNIDTAQATEAAADVATLNDLQVRLDNLQSKMGINADGTPIAWAVNSIAPPTSFKDADAKLDQSASVEQGRLDLIMGHTDATSFTNQIADVVFGTSATGSDLNANQNTTLLTIQDISASLSGDPSTIDPATVRDDLITYINDKKTALLDGVAAVGDTLAELSSSVYAEIGFWTTVDGQLDTEASTTTTNSSLAAAGTENFGFATGGYTSYTNGVLTGPTGQSTPYIAASTSLKAADVALDTQLKARADQHTNWATHLNLSGDLEADGAVTLTTVSFTADSGRFTVPRMSATQAESAFGNSTELSNGDHDGKFVYVTGTGNAGNFQQGDKLYMCENGVWHASSFIYVP